MRSRAGFTQLRQKGSHVIFGKGERRAIVPIHGGNLKPGTASAILEASGLSFEDLLRLIPDWSIGRTSFLFR
jgi:predicted RNA binding protein YcfA (HicA-like mRNA interferase family)